MSKIRGVKCQPRPIVEFDDRWKARELKRFADGKYKPVIWVGQAWWDNNHNKDHFVHVSLKDQTKIAFTKSDGDGIKDIQTAIKPGKYLTEFFSHLLTAEQIREYAMQQSMPFENKELKFATTPEEIERVYKPKLGSSCFSGTTKANLYGSGDFAVAYIEDESGEITARAVCAPERKIYTYPYGDDTRLERLLEKAGYSQSYGSGWKGLRLLAKWYWRDFYTDFGGRVSKHPTDKDYYVID